MSIAFWKSCSASSKFPVVKLIRPSERACRVLEIAQLLSVFDVFETEAQGIAASVSAKPGDPTRG